MSLFTSIDASATGMTAQRTRMDIISNNLANVDTPNYRRQVPVFKPRGEDGFVFNVPIPAASRPLQSIGRGVIIETIEDDMKTAMRLKHDPNHPEADENGMVHLPNVNVVTEMVDMIDASRAYEANVTAIRAAKGMYTKGLELFRA